MGAVVGGIFVAGQLDKYREWVTDLGQFDMVKAINLSLSRFGALRSDKVFGKVGSLVGDRNIEDLKIHYTAVAVDLTARREVWFQRGPLELAMRASGANPGLFAPVESGDRVLIDGGILNPLPMAPIAAESVDLVIAVSLHGEAVPPEAAHDDPTLIDRILDGASRAVEREIRAILGPTTAGSGDLPSKDPAPRPQSRKTLGRFELIQLSIETMQSSLSEHKLSGYRPDILINVPKNACRSLEFDRAKELIALGRVLTEQALDRAPTR